MTAYLVDTHAVLWFLADDPRLSAPARTSMESGRNVLLISAACVWEIAIKAALGKLTVPDDLPDVIRREGFEPLAIDMQDAWGVHSLPLNSHRDPFDRLLSAQALRQGIPVISDDRDLDQHGVSRLW